MQFYQQPWRLPAFALVFYFFQLVNDNEVLHGFPESFFPVSSQPEAAVNIQRLHGCQGTESATDGVAS